MTGAMLTNPTGAWWSLCLGRKRYRFKLSRGQYGVAR
jgi:hypothetical protein